MNPVIESYSKLASIYDDPQNLDSCWGAVARGALGRINISDKHSLVVDVGCGVGREIAELASRHSTNVRFVGVEPAEKMREIAIARNMDRVNVNILEGRFENLPLETGSVDYLYSILAFHWTTNLKQSASELARVLKATGEMDLCFIGRNNGREFIQKTTPVFFKYMSPAMIIEAASLRKQLRLEEASELFENAFGDRSIQVTESYQTYYDTLEGHWAWWVRIEGQLVNLPASARDECNEALKGAISTLAQDGQIPYTVHLLHVSVRSR
ncbi:MAG: hypothetical protein DMF61_24620 [Blastocatellia bacterium AA13]|nr:MAG: hypothetical protein DMF61_24620 [Blastocatellia bacterium AA13]